MREGLGSCKCRVLTLEDSCELRVVRKGVKGDVYKGREDKVYSKDVYKGRNDKVYSKGGCERNCAGRVVM